MKATLIMLDKPILVNEEEIKEGDTYLFKNTALVSEGGYKRNCPKVIAGHEGTKPIIYELSDEDAKTIGYVDYSIEKWKPITGFEDRYLISSWGRIKGILRNKIRKQKLSVHGYCFVNICSPKTGTKTKYTHKLVASHFLVNNNVKNVVNHKDGNPKNNNVSNLEWVSSSENQQHSYDTNLRTAIIGTKEKKEIAKLRADGFTYQEIADKYSVSLENIRQHYFRYLKLLETKDQRQPKQFNVECTETENEIIVTKIL